MERVISGSASDDSCGNQRKEGNCGKRKVKTKKMKRKKENGNLHRRMLKAKKVLDKKTKCKNSKSGKAHASNKICNRLLPKPLIGMYGNGAVGKEVRRSQTKFVKNGLNNARLQGDLFKLLSGTSCETKSKNIVTEKVGHEFSKNPLFDSPSTKADSPVLGTFDRGNRYAENNCSKDTNVSTTNTASSGFSDWLRVKRYEELTACCSRNFEKPLPDEFESDPISTVKQKLRNAYATTSRNQILCEVNRRDVSSSKTECPLPFAADVDNITEADGQSSRYETDNTFTSVILKNVENVCCITKDNGFPDKRQVSTSDAIQKFKFGNDTANNVSKSQLLFDVSNVCDTLSDTSEASVKTKNLLQPRRTKTQSSVFENHNTAEINKHNYLTIETNHDSDQITFKKMNDNANHSADFLSKCSVHEKNGDVNNSIVLRSPFFSEISKVDLSKTRRYTMKHEKQCTKPVPSFKHTVNNTTKFKVKPSHQSTFKKNLKHVPAILRRCNNKVSAQYINSENELEEFKKEPRASRNATMKQNTVTTERCLPPELVDLETEPKVSKNLNAHFYTSKSEPTLSNATYNAIQKERLNVFDGVYVRNRSVNESTYTDKATQYPPIQKTIVFTKKDICNIEHCMRAKDLHVEKPIQDSDVREIRKKCYLQREKSSKNACSNDHHNFQQIPVQHRFHRYSQNSDDMCFSRQELDERKPCPSSNPVICKKFLISRKMQQNAEHGKSQILHHDGEPCTCLVTDCHRDTSDVHRFQDFSSSNDSTDGSDSRTAPQENYLLCSQDSCDSNMLSRLRNLKVLAVDKSDAQLNIKVNNIHCIGSKVVLKEIRQPVKYLAFENELKIQRLPIYASSNEPVESNESVKLIDSKTNRWASQTYPQSTVQKIVFAPKCEWKKTCAKPRNLDCSSVPFEGCSHFRQNKIAKGCDADDRQMFAFNLRNANNTKESRGRAVNSDDIQCRGIHEHSMNNACAKGQVFYYRE